MTAQDSATHPPTIAIGSGTLLVTLAVVSFSFSFPATVWTLDGFGPWTATGLRGMLAGLLAAACLVGARVPLPERRHWPGLLTVAGGCVIGFPLLTTLALQTSTTAHSAVVIGVLPLATAAISTTLTGHRPSRVFWAAALTGGLTVTAFTLQQSHGRPALGDAYLCGALLLCGAGYAQGGRLASHMPGWQVIAWGVVAAMPVSVLVTGLALPVEPVRLTTEAVVGMAAIGVPRASQIQLAQPLITLVWSVLLMGERPSLLAPVAAVVVLCCIAVTQRTRG